MDAFFLAPLTLLLTIQTLNFLHAQTTGARMKTNTLKKVRSKSGLKIQELDGRGYAKEALLNYEDRMKLFIDRESALKFSRDYTAQQQKDIFASMNAPNEGSQAVAASEEHQMLGDQDISSDGEGDRVGSIQRR